MISFSLTGWRGKHGQDVVWRWRGTACVALGRPQNLSWCRYFSFPFLCVSQPPVRVFRHEPDNKPMQSVVRWTSMDRLRGRRESAKPWSDAETDDERDKKCRFSNVVNASVKAGRPLAPCNRSGPDVVCLSASRAPVVFCLFSSGEKSFLDGQDKGWQRETEVNGI